MFLSGIPGRGELYDSELQRRAVYLANEEKLINAAVEELGPGRRPAGFWDYRAELPEGANGLKYLIENDLLLEGELAEIKAEFYEKLNGPCPEGWTTELLYFAEAIGGEIKTAWQCRTLNQGVRP
jgi:hypothetical protein